MTTTKSAGIWMDHANAHLMEFTTDPIETINIASPLMFTQKKKAWKKANT